MKLPTPTRAAVKHGACILAGALLYALAFNLFLNGNHIAAGCNRTRINKLRRIWSNYGR